MSGTFAQRSSARPNPIGRPIRMPISDSVTVTTAPCRMAAMSPPLMSEMLPPGRSELRFERHRKIRERFAEPLLLQLGKTPGLLLLGDEAVEEFHQVLVAFGDRPGRERWSGHR